jgi:hypothetical protein
MVLQWNAVALWAWDIVVDNCAICRNHIMDLCKPCQLAVSGTFDGFYRHRMSSQSRVFNERGMHCRMGYLQRKSREFVLWAGD